VAISIIYSDPISGGQLYQAGAKDLPGTPPNFTFNWQTYETQKAIADGLQRTGVKVLVLAAKEYQIPIRNDGFTEAIYLPFVDDERLPKEDLDMMLDQVKKAARKVATGVVEGHRVMVTCWEGLNRASLVTITALRYLTKCDPTQAIEQLQDQRDLEVLSNRVFKELVSRPLEEFEIA